ncbi:MAG: carbon monoxide dehydrogenase subunit G [Pseudomonadota bacterium]
MDMQASRQLAVTQQQAWDALNDPEVLKRCIPGCDKVEATGENQYAVGVSVKIGPVSAKFAGKITLSDIVPPQSYTITFDGQGGAAGFGKGNAKVTLTPQGTGCELGYVVHASVGGKIAQLGQRLIDGAAKGMAEDFFKRFDEEMQRQHPGAYAAKAEADAAAGLPPAAVEPAPNAGMPAWAWVAGAVVVAVVAFLVLR